MFSAAALAALDLLVKFTVLQGLGHGSHGTAMNFGWINIRVAYNTGIGFGLGPWLPPWAVDAAAAVFFAVLAVFLIRSAGRMTAPSGAGAALILGGGLGNFVDRLDGPGVVNYLHTGWFPAFNLADVFVVAGAGLLFLGTVRGLVRKKTKP
ncbi:MAG: signal peptidase II [Cellulosimicrobium cellulans]